MGIIRRYYCWHVCYKGRRGGGVLLEFLGGGLSVYINKNSLKESLTFCVKTKT